MLQQSTENYFFPDNSSFQLHSHFSRILNKIIKFPYFSRTGKNVVIFPGFPGAVGTLPLITAQDPVSVPLLWGDCHTQASTPSQFKMDPHLTLFEYFSYWPLKANSMTHLKDLNCSYRLSWFQ